MPTCLASTSEALGGSSLPALKSRSLRFARFSEPQLKEEPRKKYFTEAFGLLPATDPHPLDRWLAWLMNDLALKLADLLFGTLQSRLALHLSGGTMENAGILVDRYGYPYIPGSGVKGIARRAALYALRTWSVDGAGQKPTDLGEPATMICAPFDTADALAEVILRTFGWTDGEWKDGRTSKSMLRSDLEWALGEGEPWIEARARIAMRLAQHDGVRIEKGIPKENFAGLARFLEAKPIAAGYPERGKDLEIDVVTCHHGDYYAGRLPLALDTEDPVPVYFPTVAPGITFVFAVTGTDAESVTLARASLDIALSTFGAGAKTAAGYGWFDTSDAARSVAQQSINERRQELILQVAKRREAAALAAREQAEIQRLAAERERRAVLKVAEAAATTPQAKEDIRIAALSDQQLETKIQNWLKLEVTEKTAILRALLGPRSALWATITPRGDKKGQWRNAIEAVRAEAKRNKQPLL